METTEEPCHEIAGQAVSVSVIVPVLGDDPMLNGCARALRAQTLPASTFEVIVVDNGPAEDADHRRRTLETMCQA